MIQKGIIRVAWAPMRDAAASQSEIVNALLYGEIVEIRSSSNDWYEVYHTKTDYKGFVSANQLDLFTENDKQFELVGLFNMPVFFVQNPHLPAFIPAGAEIRQRDLSFNPNLFNELNLVVNQEFSVKELREQLCVKAMQFVGIPYLWGGRCFAGIDCSGFVQILFSLFGKLLPRDASKQANVINPVEFVNCKPGDLLFFKNDQNKINHVGLFLGNNQVIHASGDVHVDFVDAIGIKNKHHVYTHKLCLAGSVV